MASPCIDVCRYDDETGWCLGCGMTREEKRGWKRNTARPALVGALPLRLAKLAGAGRKIGRKARKS